MALGLLESDSLLYKVHQLGLDKSYLWEAKFLPMSGLYQLPAAPFNDWFPCENVTEPVGWNIGSFTDKMYMTSISVPETVEKQFLVVSGIVDDIKKTMELWFQDWYDSYHYWEGRPFHHMATLKEITRKLMITRLNNQRKTVYSTIYYVVLSSDLTVSLTNTSMAKKLDSVTFEVVGKERTKKG